MTHQRTGSQPRALAHAVHAYATHIDDPSVLAGALRHTAMRHCSVGVRAEHYPIIGRHLIAAIREVLGEIATPSVIDAWSADYNQLAAMMIALRSRARYSSAAQAPGGWSCWRGFVLTDRHEETADAVSLTLGPANNGSVVQVRPGEYVSVRVYIPGENLVQPRQYTVTATNENSIRITIVRRISARDSLPAGMVSNVLCDLAAGAAYVDLSAPTGGFRLPEGDAPLVFITAGIGVTPAAAMLRSVDEIESRISGHGRPPSHPAHHGRPWPSVCGRLRGACHRQRRLPSLRSRRLHEGRRRGPQGRRRPVRPHPHREVRHGRAEALTDSQPIRVNPLRPIINWTGLPCLLPARTA